MRRRHASGAKLARCLLASTRARISTAVIWSEPDDMHDHHPGSTVVLGATRTAGACLETTAARWHSNIRSEWSQ